MEEIRFGRAVRTLRIRRRLTQEQLGERIGMSRGTIARIEQGKAMATTIATLQRIAAILGARLLIRLWWQGEALDRLLDARHAATVEAVVGILVGAGWEPATEVSFNRWGERGSIDVLAFHRPTGALLVVEVKTAIGDAQETLASFDRKVRLAGSIAAGRDWPSTTTSPLLVVVDSRTNRMHVSRLATTFATAFPDRNVAVKRWLSKPDARRPIRGLWFLNSGREAVVTQRVRTRRADPSQGRRTRL